MLKELKDNLESLVYFSTLCIVAGSIFGVFFLFAYVRGWSSGFVTVGMLSSASILGAAYMVVVGLLLSYLAMASLHGEDFHRAMEPPQGARKEITTLGMHVLVVNYSIWFVLWGMLIYFLGKMHQFIYIATFNAPIYLVLCGVMFFNWSNSQDGAKNIMWAVAYTFFEGFSHIISWLFLAHMILYAISVIFVADRFVSEVTLHVSIMMLVVLLHFSLFYFGRVKYPFVYGCAVLSVLAFTVTVNGISKAADVLVSGLRLGNYAAVLELDAGAFQSAPEDLGFYGGKQTTRELCVLLNFGDMIFVQSAPEGNWVPPVIALKADKVVAIKPIESGNACVVRKNK